MRTSRKPAGKPDGSRSRAAAVGSRTGVAARALACALAITLVHLWPLAGGEAGPRPARAVESSPAADSHARTPQEQEYQRLYREGLMAFWGGRWNDALGFLQEAVQARPRAHAEPQIRIVGNREMPYLPHFFLGQANFERGDCRAALVAWEESLRQGIVAGTNLTLLRNRRSECFAQIAPVMTAEVERLIGRAEDLLEEVVGLAQQPGLAARWATEEGLGPKRDRAVDELGQARTNLAEGQVVWGMRMLELSGEQARNAVSLLQEVRDEARRIAAGPVPPEPSPEVRQAAEEARARIRAAEEAARALDPLRRDPLLREAWAGGADLGARESTAVAQLSAALSDVRNGEAGGDVARIEEGATKADRAARRFETLHRDAEAIRTELAARAAEAAEDEAAEGEAAEGEAAEDEAAEDEAGGSTPDTEEETASGASGTGDPADADGGDDAGEGIDAGTAVPPLLVDAARTLMVDRGYERVISLLETAESDLGSPRARAHALLFRAAARHTLWVLGGERDADLAEAARRDVRACRQADPDLQPREAYFSPRFLRFFSASSSP